MTRELEIAPGTPCKEMWDRLIAVHGEIKAVPIALALLRRNEQTRKIPLFERVKRV